MVHPSELEEETSIACKGVGLECVNREEEAHNLFHHGNRWQVDLSLWRLRA